MNRIVKKILLFILIIFIIVFFYKNTLNQNIKEPVMCTTEYAPVCGKVNVQCITTPCDSVEQTFSNMCNAEVANAFDIYEGECN